MDRVQFNWFAVDYWDAEASLWRHGFVKDAISKELFLVDFFVPGRPPELLSRKNLWLPRMDALEELDENNFRPGVKVEVLARLTTSDPLTWYPATVLFFAGDHGVMFSKLDQIVTQKVHVVDNFGYVAALSATLRIPVSPEEFCKETIPVPYLPEWSPAKFKSFLIRWHQLLPGTKFVARSGAMVEFLVRRDLTPLEGIDMKEILNILADMDDNDAMELVERNSQACAWPLFWHGDVFPKAKAIEDNPRWLSSESLFYTIPIEKSTESGACDWRMDTMSPSPEQEIVIRFEGQGIKRSFRAGDEDLPVKRIRMETCYIDEVPNELMLVTFGYLDVVHRKRFQRVSVQFHSLLMSDHAQKILVLDFSHFKVAKRLAIDMEELEASGWFSLEFVYTLLRTVSPLMRHVVLNMSGLQLGGLRLRLLDLLEVVCGCLASYRIDSLTIAGAKHLQWELEYEGTFCFPEEWLGVGKVVRWIGTQFLINFGEHGQRFYKEFSVRRQDMATASYDNFKWALLDMLDCLSPEVTENMRSLVHKRIMARDTSRHPFNWTKAVLNTSYSEGSLYYPPGDAADNPEFLTVIDWSKLRPFFVDSLKWAYEKDKHVHRQNRKFEKIRSRILCRRARRERLCCRLIRR